MRIRWESGELKAVPGTSMPPRLSRWTSRHAFNHQVQVVLPGAGRGDGGLAATIHQTMTRCCCCYYAATWPLAVFCDTLFRRNFVASHGMLAISHRKQIDSSPCVVSLTEQGVLTLNVDTETYQRVGLVGKKSKISPRHIITLNLRDADFKPGKKNFERVRWCFTHTLTEEFDMLVCFLNADGFPSTIEDICKADAIDSEGLFSDPALFLKQRRIPLAPCSEDVEGISVPHFSTTSSSSSPTHSQKKSDEWREYWQDAFEWLGMLSCDCLSQVPELTHLSTYELSDAIPQQQHMSCRKITLTGIVPSKVINAVLEHIASFPEDATPSSPWISVSVWGFLDSPTSWGSFEHGLQLSGENDYSIIVLLPTKNYVLQQCVGDLDEYPI